jgi:hypothetical protein
MNKIRPTVEALAKQTYSHVIERVWTGFALVMGFIGHFQRLPTADVPLVRPGWRTVIEVEVMLRPTVSRAPDDFFLSYCCGFLDARRPL